MSQNSIAIVGAGLAGSILALALSNAGFNVVLIGPKVISESTSRSFALNPAIRHMFEHLGIWKQLSPTPIKQIILFEEPKTQDPILTLNPSPTSDDAMGYMATENSLINVINGMTKKAPSIQNISEMVSKFEITSSDVQILLKDNSQLKSELIIGCDGKYSSIASGAGFEHFTKEYHQSGIVCTLSQSKPHFGIAKQYFFQTGPLALLPLETNKTSIVWSNSTKRTNQLMELEDRNFINLISEATNDVMGDITIDSKRCAFPLSLRVSHDYVKPRVVILGDAAHAIHPLAGQGLNLGLRDIAALTETLAGAKKRGEMIGDLSVLRRYESWRKSDNTQMIIATDSINSLFQSQNPIVSLARRMGIGLISQLPGLQKQITSIASGSFGDAPKLLKK